MNALRAYYFASYAGLGAVMPLLALALSARGFRPSQYAWLMALTPLARLLAPPLWGVLADRWFGTVKLLRLNTAIAACAMLVLASASDLTLVACAFALWAFTSSSLVPLADAGAYRLLGSASSGFAYVRVFGSIGFAISALGMSLFGVDAALRIPFVVAACTYVSSSLLAGRLVEARPRSGEHGVEGGSRGHERGTEARPLAGECGVKGGSRADGLGTEAHARAPARVAVPTRVSMGAALRVLSRRLDVCLLWLGSAFHYLAHGCFDAYFGPYARTLPGMTSALVSQAWALGVTSEVLVMWWVPRLLRGRLRPGLLLMAALVAALRWQLLARATGPLDVWLQQPLHAITFGVWYMAFVHENQANVDDSIRATVQGVAVACMGLGMIVATLGGGYVIEHHGGRVLFQLATCASLLAFACYALRHWSLRRAPHNALATVGVET